jgi:hypothetical protein
MQRGCVLSAVAKVVSIDKSKALDPKTGNTSSLCMNTIKNNKKHPFDYS